jgi:hypothetical protein
MIVYHVAETMAETDEDHSQIDSWLSISFYQAKGWATIYREQTTENGRKKQPYFLETQECVLKIFEKREIGSTQSL